TPDLHPPASIANATTIVGTAPRRNLLPAHLCAVQPRQISLMKCIEAFCADGRSCPPNIPCVLEIVGHRRCQMDAYAVIGPIHLMLWILCPPSIPSVSTRVNQRLIDVPAIYPVLVEIRDRSRPSWAELQRAPARSDAVLECVASITVH